MTNLSTMRPIILVFAVCILAACGNQRMRFSKVHHKNQTVVAVDEKTSSVLVLEEKSTASETQPEEINMEAGLTLEESSAVDMMESAHDNEVQVQHAPKDTVYVLENNTSEKVEIALEAEDNAKRAMGWLIASFIGFFTLLIPGLIFFFIGARRYFQARNARYITDKGSRTLGGALVFLVLDLILVISFILGVTALILFL